MPEANLLLAVDQGSTSTKALLVDRHGDVRKTATAPVSSTYPRPGWVEQSAGEVVDSVRRAVATVMQDVSALGNDPIALQSAFDRFTLGGVYIRGVFFALSFLYTLWALVVTSRDTASARSKQPAL